MITTKVGHTKISQAENSSETRSSAALPYKSPVTSGDHMVENAPQQSLFLSQCSRLATSGLHLVERNRSGLHSLLSASPKTPPLPHVAAAMDRNSLLRQASRAIDRASSRLTDGRRSKPHCPRSSSAGPSSSVFVSIFYGHKRRKSSPKLTDPSSPFGSSRFLLDDATFDLTPLDDDRLPALVDPKDHDSHGKKQHDQVVELRVSLHCKGCEGKVRKHISKMKGVTSFSIDFDTKKVSVLGNLTAQDVLASVSKVKNAELWSSPMEKRSPMFCTLLKATTFALMLVIAITCADAARILDEDPPVVEAPVEAPEAMADATPVAPAPPPIASATAGAVGPAQTGAAASAVGEAHHPPLTFFMHDVLGGSHPSDRVVTGIVATSATNNQLPFAKNNPAVLPINGAVPLPNGNNGPIINSNTAPFLTGLGGQTTASTINGGGGGGNTLPFVSAGQLPAGSTLEKLMFGTTTVIDDELTEGHELGSAVIGKAQGFYVASSEDGTSQTLAFAAIFEGSGGHHEDSLSFFGVHRTASPESQVAVIGGTGKYANAKGYAAIQTLHPQDQHTTDGVETLLQFSVYLS
ncbi:hypothetical protein ACLOJK_028091 [Asimina triloba]